MATKRRKKSVRKAKTTIKHKTVRKTKKRSTRQKKDFIDKCLDFFK